MAGVIDTNILLYAANEDSDVHAAAVKFLSAAAASPEQWFLTEGIIYEFLRVSTHPKVFPKPLDWKDAILFLKPFSGFLLLKWVCSRVCAHHARRNHSCCR